MSIPSRRSLIKLLSRVQAAAAMLSLLVEYHLHGASLVPYGLLVLASMQLLLIIDRLEARHGK